MSDEAIGTVAGVVLFFVVAGIRFLITGPDCFWAQDVGVCQAILEVGR